MIQSTSETLLRIRAVFWLLIVRVWSWLVHFSMSAQVPYYGPFSNEPCQTVTEWVEITYEGASLYSWNYCFHRKLNYTAGRIICVTRHGFGFLIIAIYEFVVGQSKIFERWNKKQLHIILWFLIPFVLFCLAP